MRLNVTHEVFIVLQGTRMKLRLKVCSHVLRAGNVYLCRRHTLLP